VSFEVGATVGDYQIVGLLGAGGMGKVYKVKNLISDRVDAMKVLLPDLAGDPELADRFMREIKVLASLNHPNIAGLRTAVRLENQLLMVMEFVEGTNLEERVKAGPIPLADVINYIQQVLSALGYAHKQGVIHRDIKPANMMLTPEDVIKLMDFGIAKSKSERRLTQTGTTMGSLFYMSAEQVQGNELDGRSDLYSVGVSLYELVTGTRPFQGKSDFDIMIAQLQQTPLPPIQVMPHLPKALNDIVMIALEKEPGKRFQNAEAFSAALGSISGGLSATPMQAASVSPTGTQPWAPIASGPASATGLLGTPAAPIVSSGIPAAPVSPASVGVSVGSAVAVPPSPASTAPAAGKPKTYRGLYMTLGALVALAVIGLGATQLPRFLKTHASGDQTAQVSSPTTANPEGRAASSPEASSKPTEATPNASPPAGEAGDGNPAAPGALNAANTTAEAGKGPPASPPSSSGNPRNRGAQIVHNQTPQNQESSSEQAAPSQQSVAPSGPPPVRQAAVPEAATNPANAQELEELSDLHNKLAVRAQTANDSVENLRKQMAASGNNLRADVSASQMRMRSYMDKFDAAMNTGDPSAAKKYMALAEHEVETLEKFFGQ
jgi:serine/threonine protein kinase